MRVIDISLAIRPGMVIYPGDSDVRLEREKTIAAGDPANISRLELVEGLDLRGVEPGTYQLVCLPLKLTGSDGAPARAVLLPA